MLSVVIPVFNEADNIENTVSVLNTVLSELDGGYEIVFVDDGSRDNSWQLISRLALLDDAVRGVRFSRNFGKEGAIFAGLREACGDSVVVMDCDLQHPAALVPEMYRKWREGYEVVEAVKINRGKESAVYKLFSKAFYGLMKTSSELNLDGASDFKLLDRKVVSALLEMPERLTFFRALSSWVGFRKTRLEFEVQPRFAGKTKWNFVALSKFALNNLTSFTNLPMQFITLLGLIFLVLALILGVKVLYDFFTGSAAAGFSTVILLLLIIGAFLMLGLGIIGYYISKIYEEIKFRPRYIIGEKTMTRKTEKEQI